MSSQQPTTGAATPAAAADDGHLHPLDPATAEEIERATSIIQQASGGLQLHFKAAGLDEPPKQAMVAYLEAEHAGTARPLVPRCIFVVWYIRRTPRLFEAVVDVTHGRVVRQRELPRDFHGPVDRAELSEAAAAVMADAGVQAELQRRQIAPETVVLDPWDYGVDGTETQARHTQVFLYQRNPAHADDPDSCHYSFPLDFMVVVDLCTMAVKRIVRIPTGADEAVPPAADPKQEAPVRKTDPAEPEYVHALQKRAPRTTLKPYQVVQPEGASFSVQGHCIEWEKWRFRVGFNWREGLTLHDLRFDGRSTFYRLSLAEMFVPYGDPRNPLYRKGAFDLGNVGAGVTANNLQLGCDCLGTIKYFDGHVVAVDGQAAPRPNAICVHEVDSGIQWKHTNHRTGRAVVVRKRQLVLQSIITVANYDYIFAWILDQAGDITFEIRATGVLSTQPIDPDVVVPFGTRVADGVMAPFHQHLFCLRIDPAVGGRGDDDHSNNHSSGSSSSSSSGGCHRNSLATTDSVPLPWDDALNPLGTGYVTNQTIVRRAGPVDDDVARGRVFTILNEGAINPVSRTPIGYKLIPHRSQMLLAQPGSWHGRRSEFATHPVWVTRYRDRQLFPAGDYTNQSLGGHGIQSWTRPTGDDARPPAAVRHEDIVVWHTFGLTHNPRVEDFPVMPAEIAQVHLRPHNFCLFNPANDVPPSAQRDNRSVAYVAAGRTTTTTTTTTTTAAAGGCCAP